MQFIFVSNYINHHQIPFCDAMKKRLGDDFLFIQTEPMEEERVKMGWGVDLAELSYVKVLYGAEKEELEQQILDSDMVLFGWTEREDLVQKRLEAGRPVIRQSERLYREGQWKAVSPKGLLRKHHDHTRWRNAEAYLLCNGAYVASDFALVHAYPDKMFRWGYFPEEQFYTEEEMNALKGPAEPERPMTAGGGISDAAKQQSAGSEIPDAAKQLPALRILWAGRFMPLKHPEFAVHLAKRLKERGTAFHLDMIGAGELAESMEEYVRAEGLGESVTFHGFLSPAEVRRFMERAHIYLFTSNHLEGWGAVLNESMNSGCAVVAGSEAGAVPYLFEQGKTGVIYNGENEEDFMEKVFFLADHPDVRKEIGLAAAAKIHAEWNADTAAGRLLSFAEAVLNGKGDGFAAPESGPMSKAPVIKPFIKVPPLG